MRFTHLLVFAAGTALGIGAALALIPSVEPLEPAVATVPASNDQTDRLKELRALLDQKEATIAEQYAELESLHEEVASLRKSQATADAQLTMRPEVEQLSREDRQAMREERMRAGMMRAAERDATELVERFNLNEQQANAVLAYYQAQYNQRMATIQARRNGEEPPDMNVPSADIALAGILNDEQMDEYLAYEEAVQTSRAETGATARMNSIAPDLGLTEIQKDQVFAAYYDDIQNRMDSTDPAVDITDRMRTILSPDQFARWQELESHRSWRGPRRGGP